MACVAQTQRSVIFGEEDGKHSHYVPSGMQFEHGKRAANHRPACKVSTSSCQARRTKPVRGAAGMQTTGNLAAYIFVFVKEGRQRLKTSSGLLCRTGDPAGSMRGWRGSQKATELLRLDNRRKRCRRCNRTSSDGVQQHIDFFFPKFWSSYAVLKWIYFHGYRCQHRTTY